MWFPPFKTPAGLLTRKRAATLSHQILWKLSTVPAATVPSCFTSTWSTTNIPTVGMDRPLLDLRLTKLSHDDIYIYIYIYVCVCVCVCIITIYVYHHHHHVALVARISLTLSRHSSLSFIALGRSSGQHPVSSHSCWMYVRAGRPDFARPCVGVHKSTWLMSSSLLLQQCPACLVRLTYMYIITIYIYIYIYIYCNYAFILRAMWPRNTHTHTYIERERVIVMVVSNVVSEQSSNPGRGCLRLTLNHYPKERHESSFPQHK